MQVSKLSQLKSILNNYEFFIIDEKVSTLYKEFLGPLDQSKCYFVSAPEQSKNMHEFEKICIFFLNQKIRRTDSLCIIGGGATSDLGGFVASSLLRGINWSVIPTTLLSMIDASIGGKVGINTTQGKNLIGSFHLPQKNYFIPEFLNTLEPDEYTSGLGELIKYNRLSYDNYIWTYYQSLFANEFHSTESVESYFLQVTGLVTGSDDGQPLIGATVAVKGAEGDQLGTVTEFDGTYSLDVKPDSANCSCLGCICKVGTPDCNEVWLCVT